MSEVTELLADLVRIDSVNPGLVPGGAGETRIAGFIADWLSAREFEVHRLERNPGRPSIVGIARGTGGGRSLLFDGHTDTVGVGGYEGDPFDPAIADGRLHGRGSGDMKCGVAAMLVAADRARRMRLKGDVIVAAVADEEHASLGSEEVAEAFGADAVIVTEPTGMEIIVTHKGFVWADVIVTGRAAHGSRPDLGIDAIVMAGHFLVALGAEGQRLAATAPVPLLGTGSVHASLIAGGHEMSSYPAECRVRLERRTVPGETVETVTAELQAIIARLGREVPGFAARLEIGFNRGPLVYPGGDAIVPLVQTVAEELTGKAPPLRGMTGWTDAAVFDARGIPSILFGPVGEGFHAKRMGRHRLGRGGH
ncbi:MAG: ArgE/DapE family deacylase [Hyphomicrobiaceae bacterium]